MAKFILALDQATSNTGWALYENDKLVDYGVARAEGYEDKKINVMRVWLTKKIQEINLIPNSSLEIILEDIQLQRNDVVTFKKLARLQGVLINTVYQNNIPYFIYFSSEWKKTCGVKGRSRPEQKKNAQDFVGNRFNIKVIQDTCDAICIGYHHINKKSLEINFE